MKSYVVNEIFYSLQGEGMRAGTANLFLRLTGCNETCRLETHGFDCDTEFASGRRMTLEEIVAELRRAEAETVGVAPAAPSVYVKDAAPSDLGAGRMAPTDPSLQVQDGKEPPTQNDMSTPPGSESASASAMPAGRPQHTCGWVILTGGEPGLQVDRALIDALHAAGYRLAIETNGSIALPEGIDWITVSPKVAEHAIRQRTASEVKYVRGWGQAIPRTVVEADYKLISPAFIGEQVDARALAWCIQLVKQHPVWRLSVQQHKFWCVR